MCDDEPPQQAFADAKKAATKLPHVLIDLLDQAAAGAPRPSICIPRCTHSHVAEPKSEISKLHVTMQHAHHPYTMPAHMCCTELT